MDLNKKGDILKVVRRNIGHDEGSELRDSFIVKKIEYNNNINTFIYFPDDDSRGAFEMQLEPNVISNWKQKIQE